MAPACHIANQMDMGDGGAAGMEDRIAQSVLNALHAQDAATQRQGPRGNASGRGGGQGFARGGRGGRPFSGPRGPPVVPGVPPEIVRQRLDAQQCVRCGAEGHRSPACPNAITASAARPLN